MGDDGRAGGCLFRFDFLIFLAGARIKLKEGNAKCMQRVHGCRETCARWWVVIGARTMYVSVALFIGA